MTRRLVATVALVAAFVVAIIAPGASAKPDEVKPTIVLVHGAFADASGWTGVSKRLQARGYKVLAPANPLRGVAADAGYLRSVLATIAGPIVLVGHSYGGMVTSNAATHNDNVKALVYVAAYAPDEGDSVASLAAQARGGEIGPSTLDFRPFPLPDGTTAPEATIKIHDFRKIFAADVPARRAATMAVAQRPLAAAALGEPSGPPAWKTIPSWYVIPGADRGVGTATERIMARRIGAHTMTVAGASHVVMISHPAATTKVILAAANAG